MAESTGAGTRPQDRRRSQRVVLAIPVEVSWTRKDGIRVTEHAETTEVNAHGALLRTKTAIPVSTELELRRPRQGLTARGRVVQLTTLTEPPGHGVAVELAVPSATFWGITIPA